MMGFIVELYLLSIALRFISAKFPCNSTKGFEEWSPLIHHTGCIIDEEIGSSPVSQDCLVMIYQYCCSAKENYINANLNTTTYIQDESICNDGGLFNTPLIRELWLNSTITPSTTTTTTIEGTTLQELDNTTSTEVVAMPCESSSDCIDPETYCDDYEEQCIPKV